MNKHIRLFDRIAYIYKFFFGYQTRRFEKFVKVLNEECKCHKILDVGFGTGALLNALHKQGKDVYGVDGSEKMVKIASKKVPDIRENLQQQDITEGLPYEDNTFDCVISSYVVHGLNVKQRKIYYNEAKRVATQKVILYEHSKKPNILVKIAEFLEGGEYFRFRKIVDKELDNHFDKVKKIKFSKNVTVYLLEF